MKRLLALFGMCCARRGDDYCHCRPGCKCGCGDCACGVPWD